MSAELLLDPAAHPIIGHRGASGLAPENTIAAFDLALSQGAEALELDVRLNADGCPVVLHDPSVARTTDGKGEVRSLSAAQIAQLDAGAWFTPDGGRSFPYRDRGVGVPTLSEVLSRFPTTPLLVDLKTIEAASAVARELLRAGADRVVVASFLDGAVEAFRKPPFQPGASRRDIVSLAVRSFLGLPARARGPLLYAVPRRYKDRIPVPTRAFVHRARLRGRPVHVWTVNEVEVAHELWDRGCAGMITNYPALLRDVRDKRFGG